MGKRGAQWADCRRIADEPITGRDDPALPRSQLGTELTVAFAALLPVGASTLGRVRPRWSAATGPLPSQGSPLGDSHDRS